MTFAMIVRFYFLDFLVGLALMAWGAYGLAFYDPSPPPSPLEGIATPVLSLSPASLLALALAGLIAGAAICMGVVHKSRRLAG